MKNSKTKASPYQTDLSYNEWINHINNELEKYAESNRSIQREDIMQQSDYKSGKSPKITNYTSIEKYLIVQKPKNNLKIPLPQITPKNRM